MKKNELWRSEPPAVPFESFVVYPDRFVLIKSGQVTLEVRFYSPRTRRIAVGTRIRFNNDNNCVRYVKRIAHYSNFDSLVDSLEDTSKIHPTKSLEELFDDPEYPWKGKERRRSLYLFELAPQMPQGVETRPNS